MDAIRRLVASPGLAIMASNIDARCGHLVYVIVLNVSSTQHALISYLRTRRIIAALIEVRRASRTRKLSDL